MLRSTTVTWISTAVAATALLFAAWQTWRLHDWPQRGIDDANIYFSYAENLASGHGLSYGHAHERVDGCTSLLWTVLCSLNFLLGLGEKGIFGLSVALYCLTHLALLRVVRKEATERKRASWPYEAVYIALIVSSPAYVTWMTVTLMDTCLWGATAALLAILAMDPPTTPRGRAGAAVVLALSTLVRPDALLVGPAALCLIGLVAASRAAPRVMRFMLGLALAFVAAVAGLTVFRLAYFGYPLPNTFYAKVSPSLAHNLLRGLEYLNSFASGPVVGGGLLAFLVGTAGLLGRLYARASNAAAAGRFERHEVACALGMCLMAVPVLAGGDHFNLWRFFQPAYPLMCLSAAMLLLRAQGEPGMSRPSLARRVLVAAAFVYWLFWYGHVQPWSDVASSNRSLTHEFKIAEDSLSAGSSLGQLFAGRQPLPSVGVITSGGTPRTYPGRVIDLLGLNHVAMGHSQAPRTGVKNHSAFEKSVFFQDPPDVVLAAKEHDHYLTGLFDDPRFLAGWRHGQLARRSPGSGAVIAYFRVQLLDQLRASSEYVFTGD